MYESKEPQVPLSYEHCFQQYHATVSTFGRISMWLVLLIAKPLLECSNGFVIIGRC